MYKLMIVDDEFVVIESIENIIKHNFDNIQVVGSAESGTEFIDKVHKLQPDIVFMDIEMSDMTGLDAIEKVKNTIEAKFIILTAYDYFTYSKRALKSGVEDYLLKPFDQEEIIKSVTSILRNIERDQLKKTMELKIKNQLHQSLDLIEQECVEKILLFNKSEEETISAFLDTMKLDISYCCAAIIKFPRVMTTSINLQIKSIIKKSVNGLCGQVDEQEFCIIIPLSKAMSEVDRKAYKVHKSNKLYQSLSESIGQKPLVVFGNTYKGISGANDSYVQAGKALDQSSMRAGTLLVTSQMDDILMEESDVDNSIWYLEKVLFGRMKLGEEKTAIKAVEELMALISKAYKPKSDLLRIRIIELVVEVYRFAQKENVRQDPVKLNYSDYLATVFNSNEKTIRYYLTEAVRYICENIESSDDDNQALLKEARHYMLEHFDQDIKVEEVASKLFVSQSYLSKKFKDTFGETCSDFIIRTRIEKAIEFLENTKMSVKEIAYEVGYDDPNYFCRIFKKKTGHVAGDFRERYRQ